MSKNNKYQPGPNDFLDYSEGKLHGRKRNQFERYLEQNLFDAEAAEGLSQVTRQEAEDDLMTASRNISGRINRRKRIAWYSAAAAIASILIVSTIFLRIDNTPSDRTESIDKMSEAAEQKPVEREERGKKEGIMHYADDTRDTKGGKSEPETVSESEKITPQPAPKTVAKKAEKVPEAIVEKNLTDQKQDQGEALPNALAKGEPEADFDLETEAEEFKKDVDPAAVEQLQEVSAAAGRKEEAVPTSKRMAAPQTSGDRMKAVSEVPDQELDEVSAVGYGVDAAAKQPATGGVAVNEQTTPFIPASPIEGITAYQEYLDKTLLFPAADSALESGLVVIAFYLLPDGRPHNIKVLQSPSQAFSDEATRVVLNGPDWKPATRNGEYADEEVQLRVAFGEKHKR